MGTTNDSIEEHMWKEQIEEGYKVIDTECYFHTVFVFEVELLNLSQLSNVPSYHHLR